MTANLPEPVREALALLRPCDAEPINQHIVALATRVADLGEKLEARRNMCDALRQRAVQAEAQAEAHARDAEKMREALADLISWFPDKPAPAEWRITAGSHGADDAITAAHDALGHKKCRFCAWRGVPEAAADPYTTDGTVEVCGGCNNAESFV